MFTLRFDMRAPDWAGPAADLYGAAIDMCAWAETRGAVLAILAEHHGADDGHLLAPLTLASAIAARTSTLAILLAAVPIPMWDPVRLVEEMSVLDLISRGRVSYVFGVGHRHEEYERFGIDMATRGRVADEILAVLAPLVRGEPVEYRGRRVRVSRPCASANGPMMLIAGGSRAAAGRAGALGLGFICQINSPDLREYYESQCRVHGHRPGVIKFRVPDTPTTVFVADSAEALRAESGPYRIFTPDEASAYVRSGRPLPLHPLCGCVAPEVAWPYLERAATCK